MKYIVSSIISSSISFIRLTLQLYCIAELTQICNCMMSRVVLFAQILLLSYILSFPLTMTRILRCTCNSIKFPDCCRKYIQVQCVRHDPPEWAVGHQIGDCGEEIRAAAFADRLGQRRDQLECWPEPNAQCQGQKIWVHRIHAHRNHGNVIHIRLFDFCSHIIKLTYILVISTIVIKWY